MRIHSRESRVVVAGSLPGIGFCFSSIHFQRCDQVDRAPSRRGRLPRFSALLGTVLLALAWHTALASAQSRREDAAAAYRRAERLRVALETRGAPSVAEYRSVVRAFQLVYRTDPAYPRTPAALAAAAEVYEEMGRRFTSDRYYSEAIGAYQFLIAQYPSSSLARDSLFTIAELYRVDIENPEAARSTYQKFLEKYPHSVKASEAQERIASLDHTLERWSAGRSAPAQATFRSQAPAGPIAASSLEQVQQIQDWVGASYTRVVIKVEGPVKFSATQLVNPPRLVFDLRNTRLSPDLAARVFPVGTGFLRRIRVAQFKPDMTRVVLDVPQAEGYSAFCLPNPFRLVIDVHGAPQTLVAHTTKPGPGKPNRGFALPQSTDASGSHSPYRAFGSDYGSSATAPPTSPAPPEDASRYETGSEGAAELATRPSAASSAGLQPLPSASPASSGPQAASQNPALAAASPTLTRALGLKIRRIVIDPGHGGHDTGTIGPTGVEEKTVVLDVALRLRKLIERRMGCQVIMTRSTDVFIPLEERTAIANEYGADLFISIHANASRDPSARGIETYYLNFTSDPEALALAARENSSSQESVYQLQSLIQKIALSEKIDESSQFARIVDRRLARDLTLDGDPQRNRGVKKAPFVVLIGANMPSVLVEISFLSNRHDEHLLSSGSYREKIAKALCDGITRYAATLGTIKVAQRAGPQTIRQDPPNF